MRSSTLLLFPAWLLIQPSLALASENAASASGGDLMLTIVVVLFSGLVGYAVRSVTSFGEYKQRAYQEILSPVLTMVYKRDPGEQEERAFNQALSKPWLYASKDVAKKMDRAVSILHDPRRGNRTEALQEAIVAMRRDIQISPRQKLDPDEVAHLYSQLSGRKKDDESI